MIVVNHNGRPYLRECLASLMQTDYPNFEILVVDNSSTDGSLESTEDLFQDSRLGKLRLSTNVGYAEACNFGSRYVSGEIIAFLNNDLLVDDGWLRPLVSLMRCDLTIGAVQPTLLLKDDPSRLDAAGGFIDIFGCSHERRGFSSDFHSLAEVFYAKGAAIVVRSDLFRTLGGFDESFFLYYEETDLCWRVWLAGYRVMYVPGSIAYHVRAASTSCTL